MSACACVEIGGQHVHVTYGPSFEVSRRPDRVRWCFGCRAHLPHDFVVLDDPPEWGPSYYEPIGIFECSRCKKDRTEFPQ